MATLNESVGGGIVVNGETITFDFSLSIDESASGVTVAFSVEETIQTAAYNLIVDLAEQLNFPAGTPTINIISSLSNLLVTGHESQVQHSSLPQGSHPVATVNIVDASTAGLATGTIIQMQANSQDGVVLTGTESVKLLGPVASALSATPILLAGNSGNDTIKGLGNNGTIVGGNGNNRIKIGDGNMYVFSGTGTDKIIGGAGNDTIQTTGSALVFMGTGASEYFDASVAGSNASVTVYGGSGVSWENSGQGKDTLVGGSGISYLTDIGTGNVTFDISKANAGGLTIIQGFQASDQISTHVFDSSLQGYNANKIINHATVAGGNTYISFGNGTKIVLVGFTGPLTGHVTGP